MVRVERAHRARQALKNQLRPALVWSTLRGDCPHWFRNLRFVAAFFAGRLPIFQRTRTLLTGGTTQQ